MLQDDFGRDIDYLRLSITERCNLNCFYCRLGEKQECQSSLSADEVLSATEIHKIVLRFSMLGVRRIRITGGEPLLRSDLLEIVQRIAILPAIDDLSLTTNGVLLAKKAAELKKAGLMRVNISMDSLNPAVLKKITRGDVYAQLLEGIEASVKVGLVPVKINVVLMKGINDTEIEKFLKLTLNPSLHVRFIEFMPIGMEDKLWEKHFIALQEVIERCKKIYPLVKSSGSFGGGPAEYYQIKGSRGKMGFISPLSRHFCKSCNRLRITSSGAIKPCLFTADEIPLRPYLDNPGRFKFQVEQSLKLRPDPFLAGENSLERILQCDTSKQMSMIGG